MKRSLKLIFPVSGPMAGMMRSFTMDETIFPNAPPIITPTARSITLPRMANALNSLRIGFTFLKGFSNSSSGFIFQIGQKVFHVVFRCVPTAHQAAIARADMGVELPTARAQSGDGRIFHAGKNGVGLARKYDFNSRNFSQAAFEFCGH